MDVDRSQANQRNEWIIGRSVVIKEIMGSLKKTKGWKGSVVYGIVVKLLKKGGINIKDWLMRISDRCVETGFVREYRRKACFVPMCK